MPMTAFFRVLRSPFAYSHSPVPDEDLDKGRNWEVEAKRNLITSKNEKEKKPPN